MKPRSRRCQQVGLWASGVQEQTLGVARVDFPLRAGCKRQVCVEGCARIRPNSDNTFSGLTNYLLIMCRYAVPMTRRIALHLLFLSLSAILLSASPALACDCLPPLSPDDYVRHWSDIFTGRATGTISGQTTFQVSEKWKGKAGSVTVVTHMEPDGANCGVSFATGRRYLVRASRSTDGVLSTSVCSFSIRDDDTVYWTKHLEALRHFRDERQALEKQVSEHPDELARRLALARHMEDYHEAESALAAYRSAIPLDPGAAALEGAARGALMFERYDEALALAAQALARNPASIDAHRVQDQASLKSGKR